MPLVKPMTKVEREELCTKSLYCFGSRYRWKRLIEKGRYAIITLPDGTREKRWQPVTLEQVEKVMQEIIDRREEELERLKTDSRQHSDDTGRDDSATGQESRDSGGEEVRPGEAGSDVSEPVGNGGDSESV